MGKHLTHEQAEEIREAQRQRPGRGRYEWYRGKFAADLGRRYGVPPRAILDVLAGRTFKKGRSRTLTLEERQRVLAEFDAGKSATQIAKGLGVITPRVRHALVLASRITPAEYHHDPRPAPRGARRVGSQANP